MVKGMMLGAALAGTLLGLDTAGAMPAAPRLAGGLDVASGATIEKTVIVRRVIRKRPAMRVFRRRIIR